MGLGIGCVRGVFFMIWRRARPCLLLLVTASWLVEAAGSSVKENRAYQELPCYDVPCVAFTMGFVPIEDLPAGGKHHSFFGCEIVQHLLEVPDTVRYPV